MSADQQVTALRPAFARVSAARAAGRFTSTATPTSWRTTDTRPQSNGKIAHAEVQIGDSVLMIGDEQARGTDPSPKTLGGSPVALFNCDLW